MGDRSGIEWTDATWNPVTGCTKVSPGCDNCYAESIAHRFAGTKAYPNGFEVTLHPERLDQPLRWRRPRRVFVNSMSDLFHDDIPESYIGTVFYVMSRAPQHTFQVLTKRHGRMRSLLNSWATKGIVTDLGYLHNGRPLGEVRHTAPLWTPPPNVWLGVSVEDQKWADIRVPALLETPAAVRFLSCEPLLGPIDLLGDVEVPGPAIVRAGVSYRTDYGTGIEYDVDDQVGIDWVIVGGESGPMARPMHPDWARQLRDQCTTAGVPFFFKQWGEWAPDGHWGADITSPGQMYVKPYLPRPERMHEVEGYSLTRMGKKRAGRELDGRTWDEMPEVPDET